MDDTRYTPEPVIYYGLAKVDRNGDMRIITKEDVPDYTAKCIIMESADGADVILVIGWDFDGDDYYHNDLRSAFQQQLQGYSIKGGGRIHLHEMTDTYIIYEKSVDYGKMDKKTVAAFCKIIGNCYWGAPYA